MLSVRMMALSPATPEIAQHQNRLNPGGSTELLAITVAKAPCQPYQSQASVGMVRTIAGHFY
ncbi:hypothetical protein ANO14919_093350 [Xylariales sp. No.14919]|nr:hypothetical protein ANO14919_093350 [Xylariales sp. No.14919]